MRYRFIFNRGKILKISVADSDEKGIYDSWLYSDKSIAPVVCLKIGDQN